MKRYLILLFFACLFCCKLQIQAQCDCLNDPWAQQTGTGGTNIIMNCTTGASNEWCNTNDFDGVNLSSTSGNINDFTAIAGDWMVIIDENFDKPVLNETLWYPHDAGNNDEHVNYNGTNGGANAVSLEIQENLSISNGILKLRGKYDNSGVTYPWWNYSGTPTYIHRDYTSAGIGSRYDFPLNSRYQIKFKAFPNVAENGSQCWFYGENAAEIDILENFQGNKNRQVMGVHGTLYGGGGNNHADYTYIDHAEDLTQSINQYDLIWDKWKAEFYFNGSINRQVCKHYYCPCPWYWSAQTVNENTRAYPMANQSQMAANDGGRFNVAKYYPDYAAMNMNIGFAIIDGADPTQYTASNTMDVESVKVWLRADCSRDVAVYSLNYIHNANIYNGTVYAMGKTITTGAGTSLVVANYKKGVFAATDEIALLDGFGAENGSIFGAYITTCDAAWDHRDANTNTFESPIEHGLSNQITTTSIGSKDSINNSQINEVNVWPNPSNGMFTLEGSIKDMPGQVYVSVYDLQGNIVISETLFNIGDRINMTTLQNGVYNINIRSTSSTIRNSIKKLIITR